MNIAIPVSRFTANIYDWQLDALREFDKGQKRFFLLKCHRRARKTSLLLNVLIRECVRNPKSVYMYIGPTYRQAKNIVWRDPNMLMSFLPDKANLRWESNETELFIKFANGSILTIKGGDDPDSLRGIDVKGVGIDEWALMKKQIWQEILRPVIAQDPSRWAMFAFTPKGVTHATEMEKQSKDWPDWYFVKLQASKSGIISKAELDKAKRELPPWLYEQEFECADITDEEMVLITSRMLEELSHVVHYSPAKKKIVSCDPDCSIAGDECVIYAFENNKVIDEDIFHERDTDKIAFRVDLMCDKHDTPDVIVDSIGVGAGVYSRLLSKKNRNVQSFDSRESAANSDRFENRRAEAWWTVMEKIVNKEADYPEDLTLRQDLTSVRLKPAAKKIQLELKTDTKRRLGRSPDRGDAFVMGLYGLDYVVERKTSRDRWEEKPRRKSAMAM
jgi:hypothetical protein